MPRVLEHLQEHRPRLPLGGRTGDPQERPVAGDPGLSATTVVSNPASRTGRPSAIESAIGGIERRWAAEVGPERWATFREVLRQIGA